MKANKQKMSKQASHSLIVFLSPIPVLPPEDDALHKLPAADLTDTVVTVRALASV